VMNVVVEGGGGDRKALSERDLAQFTRKCVLPRSCEGRKWRNENGRRLVGWVARHLVVPIDTCIES
jgi:hypothetical protein